MKNFLSAQDIEDLAAQGKAELVIDDDTVLTDLARHTAQQFGISIVQRARSAPVPRDPQGAEPYAKPMPAPPPSAAPASAYALRAPARNATAGLGSKPKGCQHGPLANGQPKLASVPAGPAGTASNSSAPVVDQLVGLIKQRLSGLAA